MITILQAVEYEVAASWWAGWISNDWLQGKVASYYTWKTRSKYARYSYSRYARAMLARADLMEKKL